MKDDVASYQERFQESEQSIQDRRTEAAQDRKIDETLRSDPAAGQQMLEGLIAQYQKEAAAAKAQFEKELQDAQADGKIDDDERKKLDDAHSAYTRAESMVDKYSDRLRSAQDGTPGGGGESVENRRGPSLPQRWKIWGNRVPPTGPQKQRKRLSPIQRKPTLC